MYTKLDYLYISSVVRADKYGQECGTNYNILRKYFLPYAIEK